MITILAIAVGVLYATALYMLLRRSIVKIIIGLGLLGHAANVLIFTLGDLRRGAPAFIGEATTPATVADPVPQALILTAIVIGFGVQAFAVVLIRRVFDTVGTDDLDKMHSTEQ